MHGLLFASLAVVHMMVGSYWCVLNVSSVYSDGTGGFRRKECSSLRAQLCTLCCQRQTASAVWLWGKKQVPPCFTHGLLSKSQETREQSWSRIFTCNYTWHSGCSSWQNQSGIQLRGKTRFFFLVAIREVLINLTIRHVPGGRIGPKKKNSSNFFSQVALLIF